MPKHLPSQFNKKPHIFKWSLIKTFQHYNELGDQKEVFFLY